MKVAVVGSGISGLGAAYLLDRRHDVTLFERDGRAGGHTHTIRHDGLALDTGFLVHNTRNYPLLGRLLGELGVRTQESQMSFSVGCAACGLEYSGRRPFAQRRSLASPRFASLLWEIGRWLRTARRSLDDADYEQHTLEAYLDQHGYSRRFRRHFLVPLTSALWSTAPGRALEFPAAHAIRFFDNHGMLGLRRFAWRTVSGGSDTYVRGLVELLGPRLKLGLGVRSLRRDADGVELTSDDGEHHRFDKVVVATHADQALALLEDPSEDERRVLGAFGYTRNEAVLHTDDRLLPRARSARASWIYRLGDDGRPTVTYSLNRLQSIAGEKEYCVTLNQAVDDEHVIRRLTYEHPLFTVDALRAQRELSALSDARHTHYAGAHHGNGFHEDGLASGVRAAAELGATW
ncbi:MAG: FAD-dependent oxidoreductase [Actinobacteria bacterium]|nr:FAD-dependent oxidoreductase [Actinomycetota bacterium]